MKNVIKLLSGGLLLVTATGLQADQVFLDDVIVQGSICAGFDCVNGESFGFDTIRVKENNLRIKAQDTSTSASFPTNDWQITFNDSANGGANKFSVDDIDGGRTPFTIEASAPSHSLYVDDGGRVGFGTSTPVVDLHVKSGNTPTLRLEQDGSSGFGAQTWDVAGNEANFFVRDASNGSTLPLRIFPGAPSNAITIEASTGDVGLGTTSPDASLDIEANTGGAADLLLLTNNGPTRIALNNTSTTNPGGAWRLNAVNSGQLRIADGDGVLTEFELDVDGNLVISGSITTGGIGTCSTGCDYVFDPLYEMDSIEEHAAKMWENKYLPAVGPTAENAPFNISEKTGGMLNELEKAHIYIEQLSNKINDRDTLIADLEERLVALEEAR